MVQFHRIDNSNATVYGGAGRLLVASIDQDRPTKLSDIIDLTTFDAMSGWRDVGATNDGIAVSRGFDTDDIEVDQSVEPIDQTLTGFTNTISTNLAELTIENRQLSWVGAQIEDHAAVLGAKVDADGALAAGATVITVADVSGFKAGGFIYVGSELRKVAAIDSDNKKLTLSAPLTSAHADGEDVTPIDELGYKTISYGAPSEVPAFMMALLSLKKDGTLYGIVFYNCKVSGDDSETTFEKGQRLLPFQANAHTVDDLPEDQNIMIEFEQYLGDSDDDSSIVAPTGVELSDGTIAVDAGADVQVNATVSPSDATDKTIRWYSSDTSIFTVDDNGKIHGVAAGTAAVIAELEADPTIQAVGIVTVSAGS
nr:MAG TPA: major tail protein [Caudoviricetes sp.]